MTDEVVMGVGVKSWTWSIQIPFSAGCEASRSMSFIVQPGWEEMKYGTRPTWVPASRLIRSNSFRSRSNSLNEGFPIIRSTWSSVCSGATLSRPEVWSRTNSDR